MILIDGSQGEGGGQILRSALALSLVTGTPFRIDNIRAGRSKPGLLRQHLTAIHAATAIGGAETLGAVIGSSRLDFKPGKVQAGNYAFAVGTAGSATLVLQTVLPALLTLAAPSTIALEGGTHNPFAPPFDFLERAFLPLIARMGPRATVALERSGFYPAGGGHFTVNVEPAAGLGRLELMERGAVRTHCARALIAHLGGSIAERELCVVGQKLGWPRECLHVVDVKNSRGPGNVLLLEVESEHVTEVFTGFGEKGRSAEDVAHHVVEQVRDYLAANVPVGPHLADQLLLPLAIGAGGSFMTGDLTRHATSNIDVIKRFLPNVKILVEERSKQTRAITIHD
jgi:RNA 3'-terminal phosphate cyclase (ATP)